jgi:hypothetical protein
MAYLFHLTTLANTNAISVIATASEAKQEAISFLDCFGRYRSLAMTGYLIRLY